MPGMRRPRLALDDTDALEILARAPSVHVAWTGPDGEPRLRPLHVAQFADDLVCHGSDRGEKVELGGRRVAITAHEPLAQIPSYFTDPARACPATTFYRSAMATAVAEPVTAPGDKAAALAALMARFQPEGGHAPLDVADPRYTQAVASIAVWRLRLTALSGKANLGQAKPLATRRLIAGGLWARGRGRDLETLEHMRAQSPDPAPAVFEGPPGIRLSAVPGPEDAAQIAGPLAEAYWNEGVSPAQLRGAHAASDAWVVARAEDRVVGTARAVSDDTKHAWIYDVWVAPEVRGRGVATAVLRLLMDHPRVRDARLMHLCTRDAQPLYRKLGFEESAVSRHPHMVRPAP